jgi:hypothetical protein
MAVWYVTRMLVIEVSGRWKLTNVVVDFKSCSTTTDYVRYDFQSSTGIRRQKLISRSVRISPLDVVRLRAIM